jgi:hypothetical protein
MISGLSIALALMVSLKTVIYLPTVGLIILLKFFHQNDKKAITKEIGVFFTVLTIAFIFIYQLHRLTLGNDAGYSATKIINYLDPISIIFSKLFEEPFYIIMILYENLFIWVLWLLGFVMISYDLIRGKNKRLYKSWLMLPLLMPLFSSVTYKFAFPYFYAFIIPPAVLFSGVPINKLVNDFKSRGSKAVLISMFSLIILIFINFLTHYRIHAFDQNVSQKEIIDVIHKIFPGPVPYIDRCSMISSYPMVGLQMTTWDMKKYSDANRPLMLEILFKHRPVFILANIVHLELSLPWGQTGIYRINPLLKEDFNILKNNFVHHWGIIYVAGKHFYFNSKKRIQTFEILIPGIYTLEADGKVMINGVAYEPGSKIMLERMTYTIEPQETPMTITLRWGNNLYKPLYEPSGQPIFLGYYLQALRIPE